MTGQFLFEIKKMSQVDDYRTKYDSYIGWTSNVTLITLGWYVFQFMLLGVMNKILMKNERYRSLSLEKQRATTFQLVDSGLLLFMLFFVGSLTIKRHILGDYPDVIGVQGERVFACYMFAEYMIELTYRLQVRIPMIVHHIAAMINIGLVLHVQELRTRTYLNLLGMIGFITCITFLKMIAFSMYRLEPKANITYRLMNGSLYQEFFCKVLLQFLNGAILAAGVINGDFENSVIRYILMFGSFILFMPIQFYNVYIIYQVRNKMRN